ncbi:DeoR family transcriptional regulator, partial [Mycobacterium tuberculosis]|nr:DeoR family transcriptional regulator [Mycobacterium tuberculosis]
MCVRLAKRLQSATNRRSFVMESRVSQEANDSRTGLLSEPRRRRILEWIQEEGSARVRELASAFQVSDATIRQDLERLE